MNMFKKAYCLMLLLVVAATTSVANVVDIYDFKMNLKVPRVYNNTGSLGYRKYQRQSISGQLFIEYIANELPKVSVSNLVNNTHKMSTGSKVFYNCYVNEDFSQNFVYIGNNKTQKFNTPSISFSIIADPSYNIGKIEGDNSLYIFLAGNGSASYKKNYGQQIVTSMSGYAIGQIGCGCSAYTHTSPTRVVQADGSLDWISDIASVHGIWSTKFRGRTYVK